MKIFSFNLSGTEYLIGTKEKKKRKRKKKKEKGGLRTEAHNNKYDKC